jgi:predicted nuclease of predicted toxin-antitoxin system
MPPPKLHLNEHLAWHLAEQLRKLGFDVTSTIELGLLEDDDETQLAFAASQQRAIVSINHQHFAPLHARHLAEGKVHWGIILSTEEPTSVLRRRLLRLLNTLSADDLKNQMRWLNEFK